jgi:hypothetical protein
MISIQLNKYLIVKDLMSKFKYHIIYIFIGICSISAPKACLFAETARQHALEVNAQVIDSITNPKFLFKFDFDSLTIEFSVCRKLVSDTQWGDPTILQPMALSYIDSNILAGSVYEYFFKRTYKTQDFKQFIYDGFSYICAGIDKPYIENRGRLLLFVDETVAPAMEYELDRYIKDLAGDGWQVSRYNVPRTEQFNTKEVERIKDIILANYISYKDTLNSVVLFGRVAVPYSGSFSVDGHDDHNGAWSADVYYSDVTGIYTDTSVVNRTASRSENWNIIADGKFDNNRVAGKSSLLLGRIDFYNLSVFTDDEKTLLKKYLDKNHAFRTGSFKPKDQAVIDDNFGMYTAEALGSNAWMGFSALVNRDSVSAGKMLARLKTDTCLWAYGAGPGIYYAAGNVGSSQDLAASTYNGVFSLIFGSYMGDWDSKDNMLRSAIASSPSILTCSWAGRPFWFLHHMAMGYPIGYSTMITQNNQYLYESSGYYGFQYMHIALMGDPTLKMKYPKIPGNLQSIITVGDDGNNSAQLLWKAPSEPIIGYNIYRSQSTNSSFTKLNNDILTTTEFIDYHPLPGRNLYIVRAVSKINALVGSYFEQSTGIIEDVYFPSLYFAPLLPLSLTTTPNPATSYLNIEVMLSNQDEFSLTVFDISGRKVKDIANIHHATPRRHLFNWDLRGQSNEKIAPGVYYLRLLTSDKIITSKVFVLP